MNNFSPDCQSDTANSELVTWFSVQQFYAREAHLLDDLKFRKWIDLFADEAFYWMPIVSNRIGRDVGKEVGELNDLAHYEEDKLSLSNRVKRLETGMAWAETPPGKTRHMISNIVVSPGDADNQVKVVSAFLIWRSSLEVDQEIFAGKRLDTLRRDDETGWKILTRKIVIDHATLTQKSLGIFI